MFKPHGEAPFATDTVTIEIVGDTVLTNLKVFIFQYEIEDGERFRGYMYDEGNRVFGGQNPDSISSYRTVAYHTYSPSEDYIFQDGDTMTAAFGLKCSTLAGDFDSCIGLKGRNGTVLEYYAPSVGLVKTIDQHHDHWVLVEYKIQSGNLSTGGTIVRSQRVPQIYPHRGTIVDLRGRALSTIGGTKLQAQCQPVKVIKFRQFGKPVLHLP